MIAAVPCRDVLLYLPGDDPEQIAMMRDLVDVIYDLRPYPVSPALLRWTGSGWEVLP